MIVLILYGHINISSIYIYFLLYFGSSIYLSLMMMASWGHLYCIYGGQVHSRCLAYLLCFVSICLILFYFSSAFCFIPLLAWLGYVTDVRKDS